MDLSMFGGGAGMLALGLMMAACVAGLAAGILGIGGGIVLIPALYVVLEHYADDSIRMTVAVATALASALPTALSLLYEHHKRGQVDWAYIRKYAIAAVVVAILAAAGACAVPFVVLVAVFALAALSAICVLAFVPAGRRWRHALPAGFAGFLPPSLIALFGTFTGIGGSLAVSNWLSACGEDPGRASGTGMAFDALILTAGTVAMIVGGLFVSGLPDHTLGYVNWASAALAAPVMFLAATFSVPRAGTMRTGTLRKVFAVLVFLSVFKLLMNVAGIL